MHWLFATWFVLFLGLVWVLFFANRRAFPWIMPAPAPDLVEDKVNRSTLMIPTPSGERIEAWLYHPGQPAPVIVMAPGLCGTKEGPLEAFALAFAKAGFAAVTFDFRTFGASEGLPRHNIDPLAHVADYASVATYVRTRLSDRTHANRIALWGTSFSAAAALCAGAGLAEPPAATILHVPYLGRPARRPGRLQLAGYIALTIAETVGDRIADLFSIKLPPTYITAYGRPGEQAFGASRDCPSRRGAEAPHPFWRALPKTYRGGWRNLCLVRGLQHLDAIDPAAALASNSIPTLVIAAVDDDMVRIEDTRAICDCCDASELVELPCAHFDPYCNPHFAPNMARQIAFLGTHLSR